MEQKRIELIEKVGNLLEKKMNTLLEKKGIALIKHDQTSQQYFFMENSKPKSLLNEELSEIFEEFKKNFSSYELSCLLHPYCIYFGIAHLTTKGLESALDSLQTT